MIYILQNKNKTIGIAESLGEALALKQSLKLKIKIITKAWSSALQKEDIYGQRYNKNVNRKQTSKSGTSERGNTR